MISIQIVSCELVTEGYQERPMARSLSTFNSMVFVLTLHLVRSAKCRMSSEINKQLLTTCQL